MAGPSKSPPRFAHSLARPLATNQLRFAHSGWFLDRRTAGAAIFQRIYLCFGLPALALVLTLFGGSPKDFADIVVPPASTRVQAGNRPAPLQGMLDEARRRYPDAEEMTFQLPAKPDVSVGMFIRTPAEKRLGQLSLLAFDQATGAVVRDIPGSKLSFALRTILFLDALHFGLVLDNVSKVLWLLFGLTPGLLFISGLLMWWRRFLRPKLFIKRM